VFDYGLEDLCELRFALPRNWCFYRLWHRNQRSAVV